MAKVTFSCVQPMQQNTLVVATMNTVPVIGDEIRIDNKAYKVTERIFEMQHDIITCYIEHVNPVPYCRELVAHKTRWQLLKRIPRIMCKSYQFSAPTSYRYRIYYMWRLFKMLLRDFIYKKH